MAFIYRLQKVLNYRIQKKDEQLEVVRAIQREIQRIQADIDKKNNEMIELRKGMRTADHRMLESFDVYIAHLRELVKQLEEEKQMAQLRLQEEQEKLAELEMAVKVLEKHKENAHEAYLEEEKQAEMRELNEIAGQRHFAQMQSRKQEEMDELGLNDDEY